MKTPWWMPDRIKEVLGKALDEGPDTPTLDLNTPSTPINPMPHSSLKYIQPIIIDPGVHTQHRRRQLLDLLMFVPPERRATHPFRAPAFSR